MSAPDSFTARRELLALQIERQRNELAYAYGNLAKPFTYVEKGGKALAFFQQNKWIFIAAPAALNLVSSVFSLTGWRGKKAKQKVAAVPHVPRPVETQAERALPLDKLGRAKGALKTGAGYAWELYQLYRRVRPYL